MIRRTVSCVMLLALAGAAVTARQSPPSSCSTPDPFASLGGGVCLNGGWLPPGMGAAAAAPAPVIVPLPPAPPPAGGDDTCVTPDPFAAMGGGTCDRGGWLPPGMAPANPAPPGPPAAPPAPTPLGPPGGSPDVPLPPMDPSCLTPDPFASLPGLIEMCHEGGWAPAPGVDGTGTVHDTYPLEGHNWIIVGDDGVWYAVGFPSAAFRVEGLRVSFRAALRFDRLGVLGRGADLLRIETR